MLLWVDVFPYLSLCARFASQGTPRTHRPSTTVTIYRATRRVAGRGSCTRTRWPLSSLSPSPSPSPSRPPQQQIAKSTDTVFTHTDNGQSPTRPRHVSSRHLPVQTIAPLCTGSRALHEPAQRQAAASPASTRADITDLTSPRLASSLAFCSPLDKIEPIEHLQRAHSDRTTTVH